MPLDRFRSRTWPQASSSRTVVEPGARPERLKSVNQQLADLDRQLDEYGAEMQQGKDCVRNVSVEIEVLQRTRAELLVMLATPIVRLPYELLAQIFEMAMEIKEDPEWVEKVPKDEEEEWMGPMVLSHVNRRFRHVALTTSSLWTRICLDERPPYSLTKLWLERAKLIEVDLDLTDYLGPTKISEVLSLIMPCSRWTSISLHTQDALGILTALSMMSEPAPELHSLELIDSRTDFDEDEVSPLPTVEILCGVAPKLRQVCLYSVALHWCSPIFSNLVVLELEYLPTASRPTWVEWVQMIRACPCLAKLVLMAAGPHIPEEDDPRNYPKVQEISLPQLVHLEIGDVRPWVLSHLINMLKAPNLEFLSLDTLEHDEYTEPIRLISDERYPALRKLKFVISDIEESEFLALLRRLPGVRQLHLNGLYDLLSGICEDDRDPEREGTVLLPKLDTLWATDVTAHDLAMFVEGRKVQGHPVTRVLVPFRDEQAIKGRHEKYIRSQTTLGYFEGSDREKEDYDYDDDEEEEDEDGEDGEDGEEEADGDGDGEGSDWDVDVEEYYDPEEWMDQDEPEYLPWEEVDDLH
ncbi:hypothetical protein DACRYDRAFT_113096 [Dacryopinax primogenitus]|uniref:Uncharacterized protein n=1 Tax=Dacryopinax primogenitus (strain DJM 731) TaxID=1858805 RepID=M5GFK0_DACPD|nr:uncharacterized protein DACRYDRAFT_113096 [Dacryopinax primogenitus]EJU06382.1 hypothetical protein DACRYDRAFT_113096 [Dacryopinax primogenitus]